MEWRITVSVLEETPQRQIRPHGGIPRTSEVLVRKVGRAFGLTLNARFTCKTIVYSYIVYGIEKKEKLSIYYLLVTPKNAITRDQDAVNPMTIY